MRTEQEMFDLILSVASEDERIRAVYMNGSRTNPNAPKDIFQDYDIVYVVTETLSFINEPIYMVHIENHLGTCHRKTPLQKLSDLSSRDRQHPSGYGSSHIVAP